MAPHLSTLFIINWLTSASIQWWMRFRLKSQETTVWFGGSITPSLQLQQPFSQINHRTDFITAWAYFPTFWPSFQIFVFFFLRSLSNCLTTIKQLKNKLLFINSLKVVLPSSLLNTRMPLKAISHDTTFEFGSQQCKSEDITFRPLFLLCFAFNAPEGALTFRCCQPLMRRRVSNGSLKCAKRRHLNQITARTLNSSN